MSVPDQQSAYLSQDAAGRIIRSEDTLFPKEMLTS